MSISTEDAMKMIEEINKSNETTKSEPENKEPITPENKEEVKVEEPATPAEDPEKKVGVNGNSEPKGKDGTDKPAEPEDKKEPVEKVEPKAEQKDESKKDDSNKEDSKKYTPEQYTIIREKNKRKEQKIKYEKRIKELEDELNKYKDLKLEHFKDKDGNQDQSSYLDWKFREMDLKNEVKSLKAQEEQDEARYIEEENRRRTELSFPDENERLEYQKLLETKGGSFLEALNEADPNGVVLGYLSSQEKYPIVMKKLMTDMDALRKVFRSHDPDILKYNIAQFCEEVLTSKPVPSQKEINQPQPSVQPTQTPEKKEMPILGKQMTSTQPTGSENQLKTPADWNDYLRKHPRGR